jgi:hypothetical protein
VLKLQAGFRTVDIQADDMGFEISMTKSNVAQPPATSH